VSRRLALVAAPLLLAGCELSYYAHLAHGEYDLLSRREPIEGVIAKPGTDPELKARLEHALAAREFASRELHLPDNGSYRSYADLGRPYAVINLMATPEFSVEPHQWCYFLLWCYAYRGYYDLESAREEAKGLRAEGLDVMLGYVPAYSTLGWMDDPLLNSMGTDDTVIASTIFHELSHQVVYARGDTAFNESFATFVQQEGLRRYLKDTPALAQESEERARHTDAFVALMLEARKRLEALYKSGLPPEAMRGKKREEFARLKRDYETLRAGWNGDTRMDFWFQNDANNATLLAFGLYDEWLPAFATLFAQAGGDWAKFYKAVEALGDLGMEERQRRLKELTKGDAHL
jgi:predicted aminopeptidase